MSGHVQNLAPGCVSVYAMQVGGPLLEGAEQTEDGPPGPKQEVLLGMTGTMIPMPLQDHLGLPVSSDGNILQSASSSQGARQFMRHCVQATPCNAA